jgi:hypothetical protein
MISICQRRDVVNYNLLPHSFYQQFVLHVNEYSKSHVIFRQLSTGVDSCRQLLRPVDRHKNLAFLDFLQCRQPPTAVDNVGVNAAGYLNVFDSAVDSGRRVSTVVHDCRPLSTAVDSGGENGP